SVVECWRCLTSCHPSSVSGLQRPLQHAGAELDDGNHVEQNYKRSECKRNGDRAGAAAALLLVRERDALLAVFCVHARASKKNTGGPGQARNRSTARQKTRQKRRLNRKPPVPPPARPPRRRRRP